ncbi:MAG: hypothetical protein Q8P67_00605 [archaeon]|nr:hypothetical protein [archaeon]
MRHKSQLPFVVILLIALAGSGCLAAVAPCNTTEDPNNCGFYNEPDEGFQCTQDCDEEFDLCGICDGLAPLPAQNAFFPSVGITATARMGGSVAIWNGSIAFSQHIAQNYVPLVNVPVATYTLNHNTGVYSSVTLLPAASAPSLIPPALPDGIPPGKGFALVMSEDYLVVGSHNSVTRTVQLWVRSTTPPWTHLWSAADECPGTLFGYSVAIDENIPQISFIGNYKVIAAGNPSGLLSGRVYVYYTLEESIAQTLMYLDETYTEHICFGESVSSDSGLLAVGAPNFPTANQTGSGTVFLYRWNAALSTPQYELIAQIPPPLPSFNLGFGVSVAVWNNILVVGDNQMYVYEYVISGFTYTATLLPQPATNINSLIGRSGLSIWNQYLVAGDGNFIPPTASKMGSSFVWDKDPITPTFYRGMYTLEDPSTTIVASRYGADVDNRGGCYIISGVPAGGTRGGAYVQNLCRDTCYGCDDVLNSCSLNDLCGVCNGNNASCTDCEGTLNGNAVDDACGVCKGTNRTCLVPTFSLTIPSVNCLETVKLNLTHLFQSQWGNAVWTLTTPAPTLGTASLSTLPGPMGLQMGVLTYTANQFVSGNDNVHLHGVVTSTGGFANVVVVVQITTCIDCFNVTNGPARVDVCGVCGGTNSTCDGCDGVPASGKVNDVCGVCAGNGRSCITITTVPPPVVNCTRQIIFQLETFPASTPVHFSIQTPANSGTAFVNHNTGVVLWTNTAAYMGEVWFVVRARSLYNSSVIHDFNVTFEVLNCTDCSGHQNGIQLFDVCGICGGNGVSCKDCFGIPYGNATFDSCNVCGGDNSTCDNPIPYWLWIIFIIMFILLGAYLIGLVFRVLMRDPIKLDPMPELPPPQLPPLQSMTVVAPSLNPRLSPGPVTNPFNNNFNATLINPSYFNRVVLPVSSGQATKFE